MYATFDASAINEITNVLGWYPNSLRNSSEKATHNVYDSPGFLFHLQPLQVDVQVIW